MNRSPHLSDPLAGLPDFSVPLTKSGEGNDVDLITLCLAHRALVKLINSGALDAELEDDAVFDAVTERDSTLCRQIAAIRARTALGIAHKARVVAYEHGLSAYMDGRIMHPPDDDARRLLLSLAADLIQGRNLT